ncbi:MAG: hypothetical protein GY865_13675, partial [candidate division Zixibacteria bacterium]|nr:hypothetical protein [candidate division Zixibacteria bacterium]
MQNLKNIFIAIFFFIICFSIVSLNLDARELYIKNENTFQLRKISANDPYITIGIHHVGNLGLTVINTGNFGTAWSPLYDPTHPSLLAPSAVYPYPGNNKYLYTGTTWIGAIVGRDTLVSVGSDGWIGIGEMWPDPYPRGEIKFRSITNPNDYDAISEEDILMYYTDTVTNPAYIAVDPLDGRPHIPLNIEIKQNSYAWSYSYAEDFILFDLAIKNIGRKVLKDVYLGLYVDADVSKVGGFDEFYDDISGFRKVIDSPFGCNWTDTINIAWIADNNGRNDNDSQDRCPFSPGSYNGINAMRVVRTPSDSLKYSFNWWISNGNAALDFGPRKAGSEEQPFRDFGGFLGTPMGDRNKYYIMSHEEFDYDQLFSAKDNTYDGWLERGANAYDFADGYDTRFLLSFGPFNISPGEMLPLTYAYIGGENFHEDCDAYERIFDPSFPEEYYASFNFDDIGINSIWAEMIYDNPGVDTDGDGYRGKYRICVESTFVNNTWVYNHDTVYYRGDNVPDFRGASPPPPPELWVIEPYPIGDTIRSLIVPSVNEN